MQNMKHNCKKVNLILANATVYHFKCFIKYEPDDDPSGSNHVAIKITKIKLCYWLLLINYVGHLESEERFRIQPAELFNFS